MFMAAKLFFSSDLGKSLLIIVAFVLAMLAAFSMGHSKGYASGHDDGFTAGQHSRDIEVSHLQDNVKALTKIVNDQRLAQAKKIDEIQTDAANQAVATAKALNQKIKERDQIIQSYQKTVPPEIQQHCSLSVETVRAINQLIDNANGAQDERPVKDNSATDHNTSPAPVDNNGNSGGQSSINFNTDTSADAPLGDYDASAFEGLAHASQCVDTGTNNCATYIEGESHAS